MLVDNTDLWKYDVIENNWVSGKLSELYPSAMPGNSKHYYLNLKYNFRGFLIVFN